MDLSKVNPILGYEMYNQKDKAAINKRGGNFTDGVSEQVESLTKNH